MEILQLYLQYISEICEQTRPLPAGMTLTADEPMQRAAQLQEQIGTAGICEFVRQCAEADGLVIPEEQYRAFDPASMLQTLQQLSQTSAAQETPAAEPVASEIRDIYEVFLDSVCLEDRLLQYLIDVLKRGSKEEFETLSHAAARTIIDMDDFLAWLGNKELLAGVEERACVRIMDGCLQRLCEEKKLELLAALLSGDEATFASFRCEAPELVHLPDATYAWFRKNYLDRYYPVRFIMKFNGVVFPVAE